MLAFFACAIAWLELGLAAESLGFVLAAAATSAPMTWLCLQMLTTWRVRLPVLFVLVSCLLLAAITAVGRLEDADTPPIPLVLDRWKAAAPLRVTLPGQNAIVLRSRLHRARLLDSRSEVRIEWPVMGGVPADLYFENGGRLGFYRIQSGGGELVASSLKGLKVRCRPELGPGPLHLVPEPWARDATRVAIVQGASGDLEHVKQALSFEEPSGFDVVLSLGGNVQTGRYVDVLGLKYLLDQCHGWILAAPDPVERSTPGTSALLGASPRAVSAAGLSFVLFETDSKSPSNVDEPSPLLAVMSGSLAPGILAASAPLVVPTGRETLLLPDATRRASLLSSLKTWNVCAVVARVADGPGCSVVQDGVLHLSLGRNATSAESALLTITRDGVPKPLVRTIARGSPTTIRNRVIRVLGTFHEHPEIGSLLTIGITGAAWVVLAGLAFVLVRSLRGGRP